MAAAARYGTMMLRNAATGEGRSVDIYISDVANAYVTYDNGSGAASSTSDAFFIMPFNGYIEDISLASGLTDTTAGQITGNSVGSGSTIRWANQLNSLNNRPLLRIAVRQGSAIRIVQKA